MNLDRIFLNTDDIAKEFSLFGNRPRNSINSIQSEGRNLNRATRIRRDLMDLIGVQFDEEQVREEPEQYLMQILEQLVEKTYSLKDYKEMTEPTKQRLEDDNKRLMDKVSSLSAELISAKSEIKDLQYRNRQMTKENDTQISKLNAKIKNLEKDLTLREKKDQTNIFATLKTTNPNSFILNEPQPKTKTPFQSFGEIMETNTFKQLEHQKKVISRCEEFYHYAAKRLYEAFINRKNFMQSVFKIEDFQFANIELINRLSSIGLKQIDFINLDSNEDLIKNFENFMSFLDYFDIILNDQIQSYIESSTDISPNKFDVNIQSLLKLQNLTKIKDVVEMNYLVSETKEVVNHYEELIGTTLGLAEDVIQNENLLSESSKKKRNICQRVKGNIDGINEFMRQQKIRLADLRKVSKETQEEINYELRDIKKLTESLNN